MCDESPDPDGNGDDEETCERCGADSVKRFGLCTSCYDRYNSRVVEAEAQKHDPRRR